MKYLSEAKKVLGMELSETGKVARFNLTQKRYLKKILQKFNFNGDTRS